jgi:hypothetical protein
MSADVTLHEHPQRPDLAAPQRGMFEWDHDARADADLART